MIKTEAEDEVNSDEHGAFEPVAFAIVCEGTGNSGCDEHSGYFIKCKIQIHRFCKEVAAENEDWGYQ